MHAQAHRCSHLHVLLPARENPQRLPLLHPHHHHYYYHDHHNHNDHNHDDSYHNYYYHDTNHDNLDHDDYYHYCCDDDNYVGCVSSREVPCEFFGWMCECACSFVGFFWFDFWGFSVSSWGGFVDVSLAFGGESSGALQGALEGGFCCFVSFFGGGGAVVRGFRCGGESGVGA